MSLWLKFFPRVLVCSAAGVKKSLPYKSSKKCLLSVPSGATSPGVPRTNSTSPEVISDDHDEGPKMKRVKIEGMKIEGIEAPPKVTATLELEEDPEIFDLSSGSRYDHYPTSFGVLK